MRQQSAEHAFEGAAVAAKAGHPCKMGLSFSFVLGLGLGLASGTLSRANWAQSVPELPWPSKTPKKTVSGSPATSFRTTKASWFAFSMASG